MTMNSITALLAALTAVSITGGYGEIQRRFPSSQPRSDAKPRISARSEAQASQTVASFRKSHYWNNDAYETSIKGATGALAAADIRVLKNGAAEIRVEVQAESSAFKFYSKPLASLVIADDTGAIIETVDVSVMAMSFGGEVRKRVRRKRRKMEADAFANAAYVFFRLQFCTWRQGFDRTVKESNGCSPIAGGPFAGTMQPKLEKETEELAKQLPKQIDKLGVAIGQKFEFLGWQAVRLK